MFLVAGGGASAQHGLHYPTTSYPAPSLSMEKEVLVGVGILVGLVVLGVLVIIAMDLIERHRRRKP